MSFPLADYPIQIQEVPRAWRGDPLVIVLALKDVNGALVDPVLFGPTWASQARTEFDSDTAYDFEVSADSTAKTVTLTLPAATCRSMSPGSYGFDVQASGGGVTPITVWVGNIVVDGDYTRPDA